MGLPRQASNFAIKAELGRKPIFAFICAQTVRYWARLSNMSDARLLKLAYLSEIEMHQSGCNSWVTFILKLFDVMKTGYLWTNTSRLDNREEVSKLKKTCVGKN